jgi:hypothetical protein
MAKPLSSRGEKPMEDALNRPLTRPSGLFFFQRRLYLSDPAELRWFV